jgi:hypothetical protein
MKRLPLIRVGKYSSELSLEAVPLTLIPGACSLVNLLPSDGQLDEHT